MYWNNREEYFRTSSCVLSREVAFTSECSLSKISLYCDVPVYPSHFYIRT